MVPYINEISWVVMEAFRDQRNRQRNLVRGRLRSDRSGPRNNFSAGNAAAQVPRTLQRRPKPSKCDETPAECTGNEQEGPYLASPSITESLNIAQLATGCLAEAAEAVFDLHGNRGLTKK